MAYYGPRHGEFWEVDPYAVIVMWPTATFYKVRQLQTFFCRHPADILQELLNFLLRTLVTFGEFDIELYDLDVRSRPLLHPAFLHPALCPLPSA